MPLTIRINTANKMHPIPNIFDLSFFIIIPFVLYLIPAKADGFIGSFYSSIFNIVSGLRCMDHKTISNIDSHMMRNTIFLVKTRDLLVLPVPVLLVLLYFYIPLLLILPRYIFRIIYSSNIQVRNSQIYPDR